MFGGLKEIDNRTKNEIIENNLKLFKKLGQVEKEIIYLKCGRPRREYDLLDSQKLLLIMLLGNTKKTKKIKSDIAWVMSGFLKK